MKILQIGPASYIGGISVHIKRLNKLMNEECEFSIIDDSPKAFTTQKRLNIRRLSDYRSIIKQFKVNDLVHIHSGNWLLRVYAIVFSCVMGNNIVVTLHSYRVSKFQNFITSILLIKASKIIVVNEEIKNKLPKNLREKVVVKEAFLPPNIEKEPDLPKKVLSEIERHHKNERTLICANAFRIKKYESGELYGLDQCIKVAKIAKNEGYQIHIFFVIGTVKNEDRDYYESFVAEINRFNLHDYITLIPKSLSFVKLIQECNIVLRPTLTDGDALTIREALFLDRQIIASDVVERPKGTELYKTGDAQSLYDKVKKVNTEKSLVVKSNNISHSEYKKFYSNLYTKCCN